MNFGVQVDSHLPIRPPPANVRLETWALRDRPGRAVLCVSLVALIGAGCWRLSGSGAMGGLSAAAMALTFWQTWTPIFYEIGPHGVRWKPFGRRRRTLLWTAVAFGEEGRSGVRLHVQQGASAPTVDGVVVIPYAGRRRELVEATNYYLGVMTALEDENRAP